MHRPPSVKPPAGMRRGCPLRTAWPSLTNNLLRTWGRGGRQREDQGRGRRWYFLTSCGHSGRRFKKLGGSREMPPPRSIPPPPRPDSRGEELWARHEVPERGQPRPDPVRGDHLHQREERGRTGNKEGKGKREASGHEQGGHTLLCDKEVFSRRVHPHVNRNTPSCPPQASLNPKPAHLSAPPPHLPLPAAEFDDLTPCLDIVHQAHHLRMDGGAGEGGRFYKAHDLCMTAAGGTGRPGEAMKISDSSLSMVTAPVGTKDLIPCCAWTGGRWTPAWTMHRLTEIEAHGKTAMHRRMDPMDGREVDRSQGRCASRH